LTKSTAISDILSEDPNSISPDDAEKLREVGSLFSTGEMNLTLIIIFFGVVSLVIFYLILRYENYTEFTLRIYVILILIIGTLLVVSSSYSTQQIAPIVGFFGTLAGYLLGKSEKNGGPQ